VVFISSQH